ncbi:predicted protein [Nematostella vectensis]|uniref:CCHC-type domain-containing protein n=1 Tax=Nematostella vectensis TaxID=45351 RepID=A7S9R4_NEMVE|nr:predicted protein [Nematostella vectensis]|eukprot:XP_001631618.1 predicted protein [Nematostella vectensis]
MAQKMVQSILVPTYTGVGDLQGYIECVEFYFELMKTRTESIACLLLTVGQYQTLRDLVALEVQKGVAYDTLKGRLIEHYGSVRNTRLERAKFRALRRDKKESFADFEVLLRNEESSLKLSEAVQEASTFLLLDAKSGSEGQSDTTVSVLAISKGNAVVCFRCGKRGHVASDKSFKAIGKKYNSCGAVGHFTKSKFCRGVKSVTPVYRRKLSQCLLSVSKGTKVKLHVYPDREPVAQPVRRLPFGFRDKVATLLEKLEAKDIIGSVEGVGSRWIWLSKILKFIDDNDEGKDVVLFLDGDYELICKLVGISGAQKRALRNYFNGPTDQVCHG